MDTKSKTGPRMSDEAVKAKTGKVWKEWFSILDRAGAKKMAHQEIAMYLHTDYEVGPWWTQMVTVTYEQERGLRDKHQKPDGYQISVSRTIDAPLARIFKSFANEKERTAWLGEEGLVSSESNDEQNNARDLERQEDKSRGLFLSKGRQEEPGRRAT
jgi:hypothetical protein